MKFTFFSSIRAKAQAHKTIATIVSLLLAAALCAGLYYGWKQYQYMQTGMYALDRIREALVPPDPNGLAKYADFDSLSDDLARAAAESFPFFLAGPDQQRNIKHVLQTALLKKFLDKEETGKANQAEATEEEELKKPLALLPGDFVSQILASMRYQEKDANTGLVSVRIENPSLKQEFNILMGMRKTSHGWQLRNVVNARDVAGQLREALLKRHARLREVYLDKNAATTKAMSQLLPIQSCSANAGVLSDGRTLIMVVEVLARNTGNLRINNFDVDTSITGRNGKAVLRRFLNAAKPVAPGEDFAHRWNFELDAHSPLGQSILHAGPLQCNASWQTLGLSDGRVLHIVEVPNQNRACDIPGHNHPEGFCISPVFSR